MDIIRFKKALEELTKRASQLEVPNEIPFADLFNDEFMAAHTDFKSIHAMLEATGLTIESQDDFEHIDDAFWKAFVQSRTSYTDWPDMMEAATSYWIENQLDSQ